MPRRLLHVLIASALAVTTATALAAPHLGTGACSPAAGAVDVTVTASTAVLCDARINRTWTIAAGGSVTTTVAGTGAPESRPAPDFSITVDGVTTSSTTGWALESVSHTFGALPGRPRSGSGQALEFVYVPVTTALPSGLELHRVAVLHPGMAVIETRSTLVTTAVPVRVTSWRLDEVGAAADLPTQVHAYNEGSDWRDDYRHVSSPTGAFDAEGEVARFGAASGFFLVSQRRGGAMSRVGRDTDGTSWVGVDWARDAFDYGPLQDSPPSYNRLENPLYPAPIRSRLVPPLGSLDLGTSFLGVYTGGADEAAANFAADFAGAVAPDYPHSVGLNTFHPWSHGDGMSGANLENQVDVAAQLGIETFMLDDQWQGGAGGESGDWKFDPARFPDTPADGVIGEPDFVTYLHNSGLQLGLWMSPLEFNGASQTYAAHPDWACTPVGDVTAQVQDDAGLGVWDVTNPAFRDYLLGVIDRLVRDYDVREFKFDYLTWVDCPPHDYADYEDAFVSLVRAMQAKHQDVTFEIDETNDQRAWPFESAAIGPSWFDNGHLHGSTAVAKLLHDVWSAAPWVSPSSLGVGALDGTLGGDYDGPTGVDALMPLALLTHTTFWTDLTKLTTAERDETAWWISWFRANRTAIGPVTYELTSTDPLDGTSWAAWQPWHDGRGYVFAFRQAGGDPTTQVSLRGVDPGTSYTVTDVRSGTLVGTFTGAQLHDGLTLTLPPFHAEVLAVTPA